MEQLFNYVRKAIAPPQENPRNDAWEEFEDLANYSRNMVATFVDVDMGFVEIMQSASSSHDELPLDFQQDVRREVAAIVQALERASHAPDEMTVVNQSCDAANQLENLTNRLAPTASASLASPHVDFSASHLDASKLLRSRIRDCLLILFKALLRQLPGCEEKHMARLKLTGFMDQVDGQSREFFDLYLSSRSKRAPRWLENRCTIDSSISVREAVGCEFLRASEARNETLNLILEDIEGGGMQRGAGLQVTSPSRPEVPIGRLIDEKWSKATNKDNHCYFFPADRAELCLTLALSFLHLSHDEWRRVKWSIDTIFFLSDPSTDAILEKGMPYLSWRIKTRKEQEVEDCLVCDPNLLDFAKLLMEIYLWERIPNPLSGLRRELQSKIWRDVNNPKIVEPFMHHFRAAIEACIGAEGKEAAQNDTQLRVFVLQRIVRHLEAYAHMYRNPSSDLHNHNSQLILQPVDSGCDVDIVHYDSSVLLENASDENAARAAKEFQSLMEEFTRTHIQSLRDEKPLKIPSHWKSKIKIAVIDSGVKKSDPRIRGAFRKGQIQDCRNFLPPGAGGWVDPKTYDDDLGHGTHIVCLLLEMAPEAELYVAKVSTGPYIMKSRLYCVEEAINYAANEWNVDIITLSLALQDEHNGIENAIKQALNPSRQGNTKKIIFAAAGNNGGNAPTAWPASRHGVIAIYASNGQGVRANFNPPHHNDKPVFATLGVDIGLHWFPSPGMKKRVYVSGTSYATPIAAAIAANVLEHARCKLNLTLDQRKNLCSGDRMMKVFEQMVMSSEPSNRYIQPWTFWKSGNTHYRNISQVLEAVLEG
ncbi:hypothetical protein B0O99DRAFT_591086 [Bisporella sp. PMI_857]|nr:hypothetical protein B0O99DRAFT_591086 [Bisporella sp. PMI_857]